ncbi:hypothetical protein LC085_10880 [Bacillus tianshenii]|uniref:hypothetical protein n=1 Tax=Sutcliffiella tianshenii TaxID=1463404 RepID=UPI001CD3DA9B|nr:hypothetical protein [Bacillus tianshenii]MCA1320414.1 hypothetical protein [Bacillus tianshenii]
MRIVSNIKYFWHVTRASYFSLIANDCLDQELKATIVAKAKNHTQEAIQCRARIQNLMY